MPESKNERCAYLASDNISCNAVSHESGGIPRDDTCLCDIKSICCYQCNKRNSCEIGCTLLDPVPEDSESKAAGMVSVSSREGVETFVCPFCGAPFRSSIPQDKVQVKCRYCGTYVTVPPRLSESIRRCPNHADTLALLFCTECEDSYCDRCLFLAEGSDGVRYLCPNCYKDWIEGQRVRMQLLSFIFILSLAALAYVALINQVNLASFPGAIGIFFLLVFASFFALLARFSSGKAKKPVSVHDKRARDSQY